MNYFDEFLLNENEKDLSENIIFSDDDTVLVTMASVYNGFQNDLQGDSCLPHKFNVKDIFKMAKTLKLLK